MLIGITGQTGSGKTTFCNALREVGINVIDADVVSKIVTQPGTPCTKKIGETFENVLHSDGSLNRRVLGDIVFQNSEKLKVLNSIIFPFVKEIINETIRVGGFEVNCLDAPTLFESGTDKDCDLIIAVIANSEEEQISRLMKRDNISKEQVINRIKSQKTKEFFVQNADIIVNNRNMDTVIKMIKTLYYV
jgi:dephospho-CoA kinase